MEIYKVERGELAVYVEDEAGEIARVVAGAGTVVPIPGGREHTIRNESHEEATAYVVFAPGRDIERFMRAAGERAGGGPVHSAEVLALAERHSILMTRPEPTPAVNSTRAA